MPRGREEGEGGGLGRETRTLYIIGNLAAARLEPKAVKVPGSPKHMITARQEEL